MTTSTDNTQEQPAKKIKKQGPIRTEGVVPALIVGALIYLYFFLFFDGNIRRAIEFVGTKVNGAEVNVASVKTSFLGGYFHLNGLQVTDKETPALNILQIDSIRFGMLWDALLRAKMVVNEATIENIQVNAPRKTPGFVVPPEVVKDDEQSKVLAEVEGKVLDQAKKEFNGNVLGDLASILGGADPNAQLDNLKAQLISEKKIKELQVMLDEKKKAWDERIKNLPQKPQFDALVARGKKLKFDTKNPKQFADDLKEADKIFKEGDALVKEFKAASKDLKSDVNGLNTDIRGLEELVKQDIEDIQKHLQIPKLDMADFSKGLFGQMVAEKLGKYRKYIVLARKYMPEKKTEDQKLAKQEEQIKAKERSKGRNFSFPVTTGYPLFWLKQAKISSEPGASEFSGRVAGSLRDLTTNPKQLGRPMILNINGDFPKQGIMGFKSDLIVDHTTNAPFEKFTAAIGQYPLGLQKLSDSSDVKLAIKQASGSIELGGLSKEDGIEFAINNSFNQVQYDISAKSKTVQEVLTNIITGIPRIDVRAAATGTWSNLDWQITSNLGKDLSEGFKKELDAKLSAARKKVEDFVNSQIKAERDKLTGEYDKLKASIDGQIKDKQKEIDTAKKQAENQLNSQKKGADKAALKQEGKKAEKKLKSLLGL